MRSRSTKSRSKPKAASGKSPPKAASNPHQTDFLDHVHTTLNAPSHPIRNQLLRLTTDSPDLLAIIKQEGTAK